MLKFTIIVAALLLSSAGHALDVDLSDSDFITVDQMPKCHESPVFEQLQKYAAIMFSNNFGAGMMAIDPDSIQNVELKIQPQFDTGGHNIKHPELLSTKTQYCAMYVPFFDGSGYYFLSRIGFSKSSQKVWGFGRAKVDGFKAAQVLEFTEKKNLPDCDAEELKELAIEEIINKNPENKISGFTAYSFGYMAPVFPPNPALLYKKVCLGRAETSRGTKGAFFTLVPKQPNNYKLELIWCQAGFC